MESEVQTDYKKNSSEFWPIWTACCWRWGQRQAVVEDKDDFFHSLESLSPFQFDEWWENIFFRTTTEKFGSSIVTSTGFPLQVSFAHRLEPLKFWNLEPQTEKKPKAENREKKKKKKKKEILILTSVLKSELSNLIKESNCPNFIDKTWVVEHNWWDRRNELLSVLSCTRLELDEKFFCYWISS